MAVNSRQNNLFAAEDWQVAYQAYSQVNLQAYDFDTIRSAMVEYIRTNFPENFNDYIESSEFIAIIELLAYLAQSIAFRMDINTRENFLETAERRDSVYKLARQLGYNPKRNISASGLMKVVSISTTEPLTDSANQQIGNKTITWGDSNNPDSYEQFITVMNSAFGNVNRFSKPVKTGMINDILTDLYEINTPTNAPLVYKFKSIINGVNRDFEFVNSDFVDDGYFFEKHPDPTNDFGIIHRNDGLGLSSRNNGFFMLFKQGVLQSQDFEFDIPVENRFEDIVVEDINETDVYLQQLSSIGFPNAKWVRIPNTVGQTLQYNTKAKDTSLLYAIQNLGPGGIRLQFADGNFASVPVGNYRLYYRTSDNARFRVSPDDIGNVTTNIPYVNEKGESYVLSLTCRLQTSVNNSLPAETIAGIKERAPQAFYAQDRMVSAQDYQVLPLAKSTNIAKIKVTNKTHAGHSRFIDITDPTMTFQSASVLAEDGALYKEDVTTDKSFIIDSNNTAEEQIEKLLPTYLKNLELNDFIYSTYRDNWKLANPNKFNLSLLNIKWYTQPKVASSITGYLTENVTQNGTTTVVNIATPQLRLIQPGNLIKFRNPTDISDYKWVKIVSIRDNGRRASTKTDAIGPFTLSEPVPTGWEGVDLITTLRKRFYEGEAAAIKARIDAKESFGLGYNPTGNYFYVITNNNISSSKEFVSQTAEDNSGNNRDQTWLLKFNYVPVNNLSFRYDVEIRGLRYIFESYEQVRFYNINKNRIVDSFTGLAKYDTVELTTLNTKSSTEETFAWVDSNNDGTSDSWLSEDLGGYYDSIYLKNRSTKYNQVEASLISNFGLFREGDISGNSFVENAVIELGTNWDTSDTDSNTNVIIANNTGRVNSLPGNINIDFTETTFGGNIYNSSGNIAYRYQGTDYEGNGHIVLTANAAQKAAGTGRITITNFNQNRHSAIDSSGVPSQDKIKIVYVSDKEKLSSPIVWSAVDNFTYADGYTDARKVQVTPFNSTGDDSPDNPIQFSEFVGPADVILFDTVTSFDGYSYVKPVKSGILDLRREPDIEFNEPFYTKIVGTSTGSLSAGEAGTIYETGSYDYYMVKDISVLNRFTNSSGKLHNKKIYVESTGEVYIMSLSSTDLATTTIDQTTVKPYKSSEHFSRKGKSFTQNTQSPNQDSVVFKWTHNVNNSVRIDPSISNVQEMFILTENYYNEILTYLNVPGTPFPLEPTTTELETEFGSLNEFKSASDQLIFRSGSFKMLFGTDAAPELQARFKVVRLPGTSISDNEIKSRIITAINKYFDIDNWDFGDTFYFTELSSYIHQQVGNTIGSIVIVPKKSSSVFGDLFQVRANPDELFLSTATVDDIEIIDKITKEGLKTSEASEVLSSYNNATEETGPYAINGFYPLYATTQAAEFAGDGTYHTHEFFGKTFYMPNGVTFYHGNYTVGVETKVNTTDQTDNLTNNTTPDGAGNSGSGSTY